MTLERPERASLDPDMRVVIEVAQQDYRRRTGADWFQFFIDGAAYQIDWLGVLEPSLARAYLLALAELYTTSDIAKYRCAKKAVADAREALLRAAAKRKQ